MSASTGDRAAPAAWRRVREPGGRPSEETDARSRALGVRARARLRGLYAILAVGAGTVSAGAVEHPPDATALPERVAVRSLEVRGNDRTKKETVRSLLPREPPALYSPEELAEFERRLGNLEIFDRVQVEVRGDVLRVTVREKWTLIPSLDLSTGRTLRDTYVLLGLDEFNLLGRAVNLGASVSWEQRGMNGAIWWWEHPYNPRAGGFMAWADYTSAHLRFDEEVGWYRDRVGGGAGWALPFSYGSSWRVEASAFVYRERFAEVEGDVTPPDGVGFGSTLVASWDRYRWHDLVPEGYLATVHLTTSAFLPAVEPRHELGATLIAAWSPTETTALVGRAAVEGVSPGNVNHSLLLGSFYGVRGLDDAFFRNEAHALGTVELRQAWRFAARWALQGVAFADAASFSAMDVTGTAQGPWQHALGVGGGARLVPTLLSGRLLRVDLARLLVPEQRWFLQVGLSQYF